VLLSGHEPRVFHPHASLLVPAVISAVSDPFYKISSEALLVLQLLVKVFVVILVLALFCLLFLLFHLYLDENFSV
jgi:hypothetical protein